MTLSMIPPTDLREQARGGSSLWDLLLSSVEASGDDLAAHRMLVLTAAAAADISSMSPPDLALLRTAYRFTALVCDTTVGRGPTITAEGFRKATSVIAPGGWVAAAMPDRGGAWSPPDSVERLVQGAITVGALRLRTTRCYDGGQEAGMPVRCRAVVCRRIVDLPSPPRPA